MSPTTQTSSLAGESTCIQPGAGSLDGLVSPASKNLADTSRSAHQRRHQVTSHTTRGGSAAHALDFSHVDLVCPINANDIQNRWLKPYIVAVRGQTAKTLSPSITAFTYRILKSYAAIAVRGGHDSIPPFLHPVHVLHTLPNTPALSTCLSLIRSCEKPLPGSEGVLAEVLQREMNKLYEQYGTQTCDDDDDDDSAALLAAFQAYLVYTLVLYYRLHVGRDAADYPFLRLQQAMMHLQEIACACSARGLVCSTEQDGAQGARPRWETWIVAETKRRTLYTMYLLDNMLTAKEGLPTFLGTELRGLPAPASKALWQASARDEWEKAYNLHLAEWYPEGGGLCIDELWAVPADMDEAGLVERRRRVDQWLEGVDEFGTMMYAVTSCTHGG
ncbi:hypothetical protein NEUTE2DRAFT_109457 [Neurospora tetrasperma FGSC 2509]|nr:hypothetical protein NEUTE2DRAFT_109457 [Neurospora tetrasperma FGSC 2509]